MSFDISLDNLVLSNLPLNPVGSGVTGSANRKLKLVTMMTTGVALDEVYFLE